MMADEFETAVRTCPGRQLGSALDESVSRRGALVLFASESNSWCEVDTGQDRALAPAR